MILGLGKCAYFTVFATYMSVLYLIKYMTNVMHENRNGVNTVSLVVSLPTVRGVGILINPDLPYELLNYTELMCGSLQSLELKIHEKPITIINIYGPNQDELNIFEILEAYIRSNEDKNFIIGGDFNTVLDIHLDKKNRRTDIHKLCRQKLIDILETYDFTDIWRDKHPFLKQYTWHSSHKPPILCRLDYFLISKSITKIVISC